MAHTDNLSIGVFIDGGYFAKIDEGLARKKMGKVNVKGLFQYIPEMISRQFGIDRKLLYITEAHYYRGRFKASDAENRNLLLEERKFEDSLIENDIIFHYKHLRPLEGGGIIEKGIDTWFALDTYEMTLFREFDYVVLISGDADHEMLARKLKALKTTVQAGILTYQDIYTSWQSWRAYALNFNAYRTIQSMGELYNRLFIYPCYATPYE